MAGSGTQIDLKNTSLFIRDGYSNAGAVNLEAGYTTGATTMLIDGAVGVIPTGSIFTITGQLTKYTVISHIETTGVTTSITFAPALTGAAADNTVITFGPHEIEVRIGEGNLTYEEQRERQYRKNKGKLDSVRDGDETQLNVTFDFVWDHIKGADDDPVTVEEALHNDGAAAGWVSSDPNPCEPFAVDLVFVNVPLCDVEERETLTFSKFRYESLNHDARAGTIACRGACNVTRAVAVRSAS